MSEKQKIKEVKDNEAGVIIVEREHLETLKVENIQ